MNDLPLAPVVIEAAQIAAQPWRNGGGQTRELLAWPAGDAWKVRVSRADIDRDGPFSAYPRVQRWFAVLQGQGVELQFPDHTRTLGAGDEALPFDGASAPGCRLIGGPTQDLNLLLRGATGLLQRWHRGTSWSTGHLMRGLYTTTAGRWRCAAASRDMPAHSLLWAGASHAGAWSFEPDSLDLPGSAWWIGCSPQD